MYIIIFTKKQYVPNNAKPATPNIYSGKQSALDRVKAKIAIQDNIKMNANQIGTEIPKTQTKTGRKFSMALEQSNTEVIPKDETSHKKGLMKGDNTNRNTGKSLCPLELRQAIFRFFSQIRDKMFQTKKNELGEAIKNYFKTSDDQLEIFLEDSPISFIQIFQSLLIWYFEQSALESQKLCKCGGRVLAVDKFQGNGGNSATLLTTQKFDNSPTKPQHQSTTDQINLIKNKNTRQWTDMNLGDDEEVCYKSKFSNFEIVRKFDKSKPFTSRIDPKFESVENLR